MSIRDVFVLRGRTFHLDPACVRSARRRLPLDDIVADGWTACRRCSLAAVADLLPEDGVPVLVVASTWPIEPDAESWQLTADKRDAEAEFLRSLARRFGLTSSETVEPGAAGVVDVFDGPEHLIRRVTVAGAVPGVVAGFVAANLPAMLSPSHLGAASTQTAEIFSRLYEHAGRPHDDSGALADLWELAALTAA